MKSNQSNSALQGTSETDVLFRQDDNVQIRLLEVSIDLCVHSRFNTRKSRDPQRVELLTKRIRQNGFERTRSLWGVEVDGRYEIFAGGTRLEAARKAGLPAVPVFVHRGLSDDQISRKADEDNENDEYHVPVRMPDIWAECYRLWKEEDWTQQRIAKAKGWDERAVRLRCKLHDTLPMEAKKATGDSLLEEGHCEAIISVTGDVAGLAPWLTTEQAQSELVEDVLSKHRGSSAGKKPTVRVVREAAARWKSLIQAAEKGYLSLPEGAWRERFVDLLTEERARTESAVSRLLGQVVEQKRHQEENEAARLRAKADVKEREALRLRQEHQRLAYLEAQTGKLRLGDARELIREAPLGFSLLLTDPPYGVDFQSNRRVTSQKKGRIAGDGKQESLDLLADVLAKAYPRMADDATCLIFTGWRHEPEFRHVIEAAGFTIRGSLVWVKNNHGTGDLAGTFAPKHERIIHAVKGCPKLQKRVADVLFGHDQQNSLHPTEKPRDLLRQLIEVTIERGAAVVDPFMGSGNSMFEAYALGRDFFGIEIEPEWHGVATEMIHTMAEKEFTQHELGS